MTEPAEQQPHDVLVALGELVVAFSGLEETLRSSIMVLAGDRVILADVLTSGLSFSVLVEKWGALYHEYYPDAESHELVRAVCGELAEVNSARNTLIHSLWMPDDSSGGWRRQKVTAQFRRGLHYHVTHVEPQGVRALISRIDTAAEHVAGLAFHRGPPTRAKPARLAGHRAPNSTESS